MTTTEDADLVRACREGDPDAFGVLVDRYQRVVFNAAVGLVNDREDARDIAQNAFLKAYENLATYDPAYKFYSWLYRIAVNEALKLLDRRRQLVPIEDIRAAEERDPEGALAGKEIGLHVHSALMSLTVEHRTVLVLRHLAGCSYEEIGRIAGVPEKTVKSRLFAARQQLREIFVRKGVLA